MRISLVYKSGSRAGETVTVSNQSTIKLGRHPDSDVVLDLPEDSAVSIFHAEIRLKDHVLELRDLKSTNGVFVNGIRVNKAQLSASDVIQLGPQGAGFCASFVPLDRERQTISKTEVMPATNTSDTIDGLSPEISADKEAKNSKFGKRTVGLLIEEAVKKALGPRSRSTKNTDYFERLVEKKVRRSSMASRRILLIFAVSILLVLTALGIWFWFNRSTGRQVAQKNRYSVFMLAGQSTEKNANLGILEGFCSAFAISKNILVTNAHCIQKAKNKYKGVYAIMNGAPQNRYVVDLWAQHPAYRDRGISPDVGLLRIRGNLKHITEIASTKELSQLGPGVVVYVYGFPGLLNIASAPEATFVQGQLGRVTSFDATVGVAQRNSVLQHSAFTAKGTSGSPIFNVSGKVIGINSGGYMDNGEILYGYNLGMRIDLVNAILGQMGN